MNGRERITNILHGKETDRVAWTTISDDMTRNGMPAEYKDVPILDFYRKIGCDIIQFGPYGMPEHSKPKYPFEIISNLLETTETRQDGSYAHQRELRGHRLTQVVKNGHPIKYPVETKTDLSVLLEMWEACQINPVTDGCGESFDLTDKEVGEDGLFAPTLLPSPVQQLIENECGPENFYYLLNDYPALMEQTIGVMYGIRRIEYQFMAEKTPFELIIPVENTSTSLISPAIYREYTLPHMREYADIMHRSGKKAVIHMCGHLKNLLNEFKDADIDGIHALTTPTIGDCTYEAALDVLGDELIIIGVLDPTVFQNPYATAGEIRACVKRILTPRIKASNFILWPATDGLRTDLWRLQAVRDAIDEYGAK
jgi:hypothetical protein